MVLLWAFKNTHRTPIMLDANVITTFEREAFAFIWNIPPPPRIKMTCREEGGLPNRMVEEIDAHEFWFPVFMLPLHVSRQGPICIWRWHGKVPGWL